MRIFLVLIVIGFFTSTTVQNTLENSSSKQTYLRNIALYKRLESQIERRVSRLENRQSSLSSRLTNAENQISQTNNNKLINLLNSRMERISGRLERTTRRIARYEGMLETIRRITGDEEPEPEDPVSEPAPAPLPTVAVEPTIEENEPPPDRPAIIVTLPFDSPDMPDLPPTETGNGELIFKSGFEGSTRIIPVTGRLHDAHAIIGEDNGFSWETGLPGREPRFFYIAGKDPDRYIGTEIREVIDPHGNQTNVLHMAVKGDYPDDGQATVTRNEFFFDPPSDFKQAYISYWMKLSPNLKEDWPSGGGNLSIMSWKDVQAPVGGDNYVFKIALENHDGQLYWMTLGRQAYPQRKVHWNLVNKRNPVPLGEWLKIEVFFRMDDEQNGRIWFAVNGQEIHNYHGITEHESNPQELRAWSIFKLYPAGSKGTLNATIFSEIDDVEIWSDFPNKE